MNKKKYYEVLYLDYGNESWIFNNLWKSTTRSYLTYSSHIDYSYHKFSYLLRCYVIIGHL